MKLFFPTDGMEWPPKDPDYEGPRPPSRTYTPRGFDAARNELEVEFVHHGNGVAANWAQSAEVGAPLSLAGPGGGYDVAPDAKCLVLAADETAMPAAGTILEAMPLGCEPILICEVIDGDDERPLSPKVDAEPRWLHRAPIGAQQGMLLERAIRDLPDPGDGCYWWIACEAATMRRIRQYLLKDRGVDAGHIHTRGYWKLGETNYPDHDYGAD
jgi:NADPH-dependent ferric siderophore reductase